MFTILEISQKVNEFTSINQIFRILKWIFSETVNENVHK
jgi:hypothetical protein